MFGELKCFISLIIAGDKAPMVTVDEEEEDDDVPGMYNHKSLLDYLINFNIISKEKA